MIDGGANLNIKDEFGRTPLINVMIEKDTELLKLLINREADLDIKDGSGRPPLMSTIKDNDIETVKLLIDGGADFNVRDKYLETMLIMAKIKVLK